MEFSLRHIGGKIIELTVSNYGSRITQDVVNLDGKVPEELIESLKDIVNELEQHNE